MKVFFGSFNQPEIEVDAWVPTPDQGERILKALNFLYGGDSVVMRARMQKFQNFEERFIGEAASREADQFLNRVKEMGS
jgi:hypothetical protein